MELITRTLVRFSHALGPKELSAEVIQQSKLLLLDYLGVAIRGSAADSSQSIQRMQARWPSAEACTVLGTSTRTSPESAALANGTAAHALELDDTHRAGSIHLGVVMFSTAIALSEILPDITNDVFFPAVIAGYEVAARLGKALQPKLHYELGFHPTGTCGVFGAAVTAAKLLNLTEEQMMYAVGIAGSMAAGSLEFLADGAWTKRLHPGLAAANGILAAKLAAEGFRGPETIVEGRDGFLSAYSRQAMPELVTRELGTTFEMLRTSIKPYSCCRYMQAPIDGLIELATAHDIRPEEVEKVEIAILEAGWPLVCEPGERKYAPLNTVDAQFSMPFGAALALTFRKAGLDEFVSENYLSPQLRDLMSKVEMVKDPEIEKSFPLEWPARVKVRLVSGQVFEKHIRFPMGDPENPMNWDQVSDKFHSLAGTVLPKIQCERLAQAVHQLNGSTNLRALWKLAAL